MEVRFAQDHVRAVNLGRRPTLESPVIGLKHLCFAYALGRENNPAFAGAVPTSGSVGLGVSPSTHINQSLYLLALEPLTGGTLWQRAIRNEETPTLMGQHEQLLAATDLMAGLMALHNLGFAHSDLK